MNAVRIDFKTADAARFNLLRDQWRSAAASCALSRSGFRVASVLPTFVNRQHGYAFPTDEALTKAIGATNPSTAKRGLIALENALLIERHTEVKRDPKREAAGKNRRIYLTLPDVKVQPAGDGAESEGAKGEGASHVKVQKTQGEGAYGCTNILDDTLDDYSAYERENVSEGTYTRDRPAQPPTTGEASGPVASRAPTSVGTKEKKAEPETAPSVVPAAPASSPAQEPSSYLSAKNGDQDQTLTSDEKRRQSPAPEIAPSVRWQDWKHPKILEGRPLSRKPFPAPRTIEAAENFLRKHHVPESEWRKLLPNLMDGQLYEFDIEPWMDAA